LFEAPLPHHTSSRFASGFARQHQFCEILSSFALFVRFPGRAFCMPLRVGKAV
jgi:hypothetical protein